jgi:Flp pilus assembly CpaF family ATPase
MSEDLEEIDRADAASEAVRDDVIHLRAGTALDLDGVARLGSGRPFRLIVLAGEPSSGKTTLLAALYELFFGGSVA